MKKIMYHGLPINQCEKLVLFNILKLNHYPFKYFQYKMFWGKLKDMHIITGTDGGDCGVTVYVLYIENANI